MQHSDGKDLRPRLSVIGIGGAGGNALNNMIRSNLEGVEFVACNTDAQALEESLAPVRLQLGLKVTQGLGAGSRPDVGRAAAEESLDEVMSHFKNTNMLFITAGMGGGTGTGGAPVIARAARESGILTVGVVTKPFHFEGAHRMRAAERGIEEMHQCVDTLLVIPNQNLFRLATERTTFTDAFAMADDVLYSGVRTFTDLMIKHGLINLDFADICAVMREMMGKAMMGTGQASGDKRAVEAAEQAISCPLLDNDVSMRGARAVLINISGGLDMTLFEVDEAANRIREEVDPNANIIFGATFDEDMSGQLRVSVVATGIDARDALTTPAPDGIFKTTPRSVFRLNPQGHVTSLDPGTPREGPGNRSADLFSHNALPADEDDDPADDSLALSEAQEVRASSGAFGRRHDLFSFDKDFGEPASRSAAPDRSPFEDLPSGGAPRLRAEELPSSSYAEGPFARARSGANPFASRPRDPEAVPPKKSLGFLERLGVGRRSAPTSPAEDLPHEPVWQEDDLAIAPPPAPAPSTRPQSSRQSAHPRDEDIFTENAEEAFASSPVEVDRLETPAFMRRRRGRNPGA